MVRSALACSIFVAGGLAVAAPAMASQDDSGGRHEQASVASAAPKQPAEAPVAPLVPCGICADPACKDLQLRGRCTVDQVAEALRRHRMAIAQTTEEPHHRSRSVTSADYERLVLDELPEPGRAEAAPQHAPQAAPVSGGIPPAESDSLSAKTQSFRPLDLSEETAEDGESSDEAGSKTDSETDSETDSKDH